MRRLKSFNHTGANNGKSLVALHVSAWEGNSLQNIDHTTMRFGVIGDPIAQSMSPLMMNQAFQAAGINALYMAFHVTPEHLQHAIYGLRSLGFRGANVTIPHKQAVMEFLDEIDEGARVIGAVNTIVHEDGKLIGYNTDGIGYVRSLKEECKVDLQGRHIVLIGAGGAARGVAYALAQEKPASIRIVNRTMEKAEQIAAALAAHVDIRGMGMDQLDDIKEQTDIVINTTSLGMYPHVEERPLDPTIFKPGTIVSDLIYNPRITRWLREAEAHGCIIHGGLGMFIYQGAYAYEYWTGQQAPVQVMRQAVEQALGQ